MLGNIYCRKKTIATLRDGPLGKYSDEMAKYLIDTGYAKKSRRSLFGIISVFSAWMVSKHLSLNDIDQEIITKFTQYRINSRKSFVRSGSQALFNRLISSLKRDGILSSDDAGRTTDCDEAVLVGYEEYLRNEKGLCLSSLKRNKTIVRNFLSQFPSIAQEGCHSLTGPNILSYILACGNKYSAKHTQVICSLLRGFLRYLYSEGVTQNNLADVIPKIRATRAAHLPEYLEPQQVRQLLASCHRNTPKGSRNYAILLLLVRMGLRSSEVMSLTKEDINWRSGEITIRGKGSKISRMPLPYDVGEAIVQYLQKYRPKVNHQMLFVSTKAPYKGLSHPSSISTIVCMSLMSANLQTQSKGSHLLRYTIATECMRNGATLFQTSELLRHTSMDTTALYTKVDSQKLTCVLHCWPTTQAKEV